MIPTLTVGQLRGITVTIPPSTPVVIEDVAEDGTVTRRLLECYFAEYEPVESTRLEKWPVRVVLRMRAVGVVEPTEQSS